MPTSPNLQTFRDPAFSLWQSAVHSTLMKQHAAGKITLPQGHSGLGVTADHPLMVASNQAIQELQNAPPAGAVTAHAPGIVGTVVDCAKLYVQIAWYELFDRSKAADLKNELGFSTCDPFWAECLAEYAGYLLSGQAQPYTVYNDIGDYVLSDCFPDNATIAIISDWGTGENAALVLLQQIAANFQPDVLIHLGDIYYSGLPSEDSGHFTSLIQKVWPSSPPLVFTLNGNHDRYAGAGGGYYSLIAALNQAAALPQPNSYFVLRNNYWQFLAMDTGYHDSNPFTIDSNVTYLEQSEIAWHIDKIQNNGSGVDTTLNPGGARGTVLLSHHPLMSFSGVGHNSAGQPLAVNPNLANAFAPVFPMIDFWLWGHEHDLRIFQPYTMGPGQTLPAGRCVGAGAVPVFVPDSIPPANLVLPPSESGPPQVVPGTTVGNNGVVFNHSYAVITLQQAALTINYYQFDSTDAKPGSPPALSPLSFSDSVTAPKVALQTLKAAEN
jgi:hypothetical protein